MYYAEKEAQEIPSSLLNCTDSEKQTRKISARKQSFTFGLRLSSAIRSVFSLHVNVTEKVGKILQHDDTKI